jgi:hypothetical protein
MSRIRLFSKTEKPQPAKVVVGYPVGGSVTLAFHASMLKMLTHEVSKGPDRLLAKVTHSQGLYVADNRNLLIQRLLETDAEWLLQIDTDIEFPETLLETLLRIAGKDRLVVAASVPLGAYPTCAFNIATDKPAGIWEPVPQIVGEVMECDGVATAVLLVHRKVFEDIANRHGQCWMHHIYIPASKEGTRPRDFKFLSQGEDLAFSVRAKEAGHRIYCAYVPGLRHHKGRALSHDDERMAAFASEDPGVGKLVAEGADL